ncbi:hypothetical protein GE09DRAFT_1228406 [Coniochaeta sp. 2T2.1]|nr:hypothetical protein GE09DRAFT_1228406 [Coniochaeta sp. 2T2.1]
MARLTALEEKRQEDEQEQKKKEQDEDMKEDEDDKGFFHAGGESGYTKPFERRERPKRCYNRKEITDLGYISAPMADPMDLDSNAVGLPTAAGP